MFCLIYSIEFTFCGTSISSSLIRSVVIPFCCMLGHFFRHFLIIGAVIIKQVCFGTCHTLKANVIQIEQVLCWSISKAFIILICRLTRDIPTLSFMPHFVKSGNKVRALVFTGDFHCQLLQILQFFLGKIDK